MPEVTPEEPTKARTLRNTHTDVLKKKGEYKTFLNPRILNTKDYHVHLFRCGKNTVIALEVNIKQWIVISQIQPK